MKADDAEIQHRGGIEQLLQGLQGLTELRLGSAGADLLMMAEAESGIDP
jgi:hypothetical protein